MQKHITNVDDKEKYALPDFDVQGELLTANKFALNSETK
jgi:hypothetical protein